MSEPAAILHGLLAEFSSPEALRRAILKVRDEGYSALDAFTPFPVPGLADALGGVKTRLPQIVLAGGILGGVSGYLLAWWCSTYGYPLLIAGRELNSIPAFVPVTFELTILCASLSAFFGVCVENRLTRLAQPVFAVPEFRRASNDAFFLWIDAADPRFQPELTRRLLEGFGSEGVYAVET